MLGRNSQGYKWIWGYFIPGLPSESSKLLVRMVKDAKVFRFGTCNPIERAVGAALRGRPFVELIGFRKAAAPVLANTISRKGRPRRAAPTARSVASSVS